MINQLIAILKQKNYQVFRKPYYLNIIGIRSSDTQSNRFDDELHVFFKNEHNQWKHYRFSITTDPGTYWLKYPLQVDGTAILKEGQYLNTYRIGLHKGQYKALVQNKMVTVIRDYDRNAVLDFMNGKESTGYYGINIHRAKITGSTSLVDKWSAGCQVFERSNDFDVFMKLCEKHRLYNGNFFTYTLIDTRMIKRLKRRRFAYAITGALMIGGIAYFLFNHK